MKIHKVLTPLEKAAKALFKDTIGNDLGRTKTFLTKDQQTDIFVRGEKHHAPSKNRRKW